MWMHFARWTGGAFFALLGPNGAGKTTLLRLLCGRFSKFTGSLAVDEHLRNGEGANSETFILDAKYYKHCVSGANLPASDSITKQLAYAEYAENVKGLDGSLIYNAFILPYCATEKSEYLYGMKRFGFAYGDWNNPDAANAKPYYRIAGIMLDVKSVMRSYGKNASAQKEMAELVKGISRQ